MGLSLAGPFATPACVGADGVSTNTVTTPGKLVGKVIGIYIKYTGDKPGTQDVTVTTLGTSPSIPSLTLLTLTNKVADGLFLVRQTPQGVTGVDLAALTELEPWPIDDKLILTTAQANTDDIVTMWVLMEDDYV